MLTSVDSVESHVSFDGIANSVLSSTNEFIGSSVSYGVRAGFEAQYERMSATAGVGYEGSSNVDELTISGNLSYAFQNSQWLNRDISTTCS